MAVSRTQTFGRNNREKVQSIDCTLEKLFSEHDRTAGEELVIFDGTSNEKLVILVWIIDRLKKDIEELMSRPASKVELSALVDIRRKFLTLIPKVQEQASDITGSRSLLSEDERKAFIEQYARVVDLYRKDVEEALRNPSFRFVGSQLLKVNQNLEVPPLPKNALLDISTFLRNFHLENNTFVETEDEEDRKAPGPDSLRTSVPMTPILGLMSSKYVSPKPKGINIHMEAYAHTNSCHAFVPYAIHLNDTYQEILYGIPKNLTYVGAKYPDGSSLSYLPIKNITVLRRPSEVQLPSRLEGGFVELKISRVTYNKIKKMCADAYLAEYPDHFVRYPPEIEVDSDSIVIEALARGYRRLRIINGKTIYHVTLSDAIEACSHDLTGDGLLQLRFDKHDREEKRATMKFVLFGLQMVRTADNYFQKIFRL